MIAVSHFVTYILSSNMLRYLICITSAVALFAPFEVLCIIIPIKLLCGYVNMSRCPGVRRTASDYDLVLNSNELSISVLKIESLSLKF